MSKASTTAYEAIRSRILSGEFSPGAHLKEEVLAEVCGVSRTPIRDALRALAADDYVRMVRNHGTFVADWSDSDIEDIFTLRAMLESHAARLAATRATPHHIGELRHLHRGVERMLAAGPEPDRELFVNSNKRFHEIVAEAAGSPRLASMIARLTEQPVIARTAISYSHADVTRSNLQHGELADAFEVGDGDWAESVMKSHILAGYQTYKRRYRISRERDPGAAAE